MNRWPRLAASSPLRITLFEPTPTPLHRRRVAPHLLGALRHEPWHLDRPSIPIYGHERQIAGIRVPAPASQEILRLDPHADFHRRTSDVIHAGLHDDQIADVNRLAEIHAID